jgi:transcriptional regulator with XRE-family HTH domain
MTSSSSPRFADVGARIREARQAAGLTQEAFADSISTSRRHVMRLERGDHRPSRSMVDRIAEVTGRPVSFFDKPDDGELELYNDLVLRLFEATRQLVAAEVEKRMSER